MRAARLNHWEGLLRSGLRRRRGTLPHPVRSAANPGKRDLARRPRAPERLFVGYHHRLGEPSPPGPSSRRCGAAGRSMGGRVRQLTPRRSPKVKQPPARAPAGTGAHFRSAANAVVSPDLQLTLASDELRARQPTLAGLLLVRESSHVATDTRVNASGAKQSCHHPRRRRIGRRREQLVLRSASRAGGAISASGTQATIGGCRGSVPSTGS